MVFPMNTTAAGTTPASTETCQERRRAARTVVVLRRADALARRAGATSGARSSRLLREANTIRVIEADAKRLREARA